MMNNELQNENQSVTDLDSSASRRRIRSFVIRAGRITAAQERALREDWPRYGIDVPAKTQAGSFLNLPAIFGRDAPRVLEIGFGNGDTLLHAALNQPDRDFLGIEVHRSGVGHLLHAAANQHVSNLRVICHDAVEVLEQHIAPLSLDEAWILFPDPWHKARHNKRRLVQEAFVELLASRLKPGARIHLATDWQAYAEQMLEVMSASAQFRNCAASTSNGYVPRPTWRPITRFEKRGHRLGHGVWDLSFQKLAD